MFGESNPYGGNKIRRAVYFTSWWRKEENSEFMGINMGLNKKIRGKLWSIISNGNKVYIATVLQRWNEELYKWVKVDKELQTWENTDESGNIVKIKTLKERFK